MEKIYDRTIHKAYSITIKNHLRVVFYGCNIALIFCITIRKVYLKGFICLISELNLVIHEECPQI
jgi:hypothetical protein